MLDDNAVRLARLEAEVAAHRQFIEGMRVVAEQVWRNAERSEAVMRDLSDLQEGMRESEHRQAEAVQRVERACSALSQQLAATVNARIGARATIVVGALAAGGSIIGILIGR